MAKQIEAQMTKWVKVDRSVTMVDEGDILTPLRRVYDRYIQKSIELYEKAVENADKRAAIYAAADYYRRAAEDVQRLLG
jgi:hypothetical protein